MTEISNMPKQVSSNQVLVRFGLRLVILGACASFGSVGFGRSLDTLLLLSVAVCAVTALPAIRAGLHGDLADQQWVVEAYLLTMSSLLLVGGLPSCEHHGVREAEA